MTGNPDKLWESSWETYYDSFYYEIVLGKVISRWKLFDLATKILVAITATGSTVAGWSLWSDPDFKNIWITVAAIASLLSIIHAVVQVQSILEKLSEFRVKFSNLRVSIETFRQDLTIYPQFNVDEKYVEYKKFREKFKEFVSNYSEDILLTKKLDEKAQDELNAKLGVSA